MDDLLQFATRLAEYNETPLALPISRRVAYVVSHGQSYASNGYAIRTQGIAEALNTQGFEVLCFVRPGRPWELEKHTDISPEVNISGVRYIHSRGSESTGKPPGDERTHLENSVERFVELFRIYRPEVVIAASNYIIGLPAWIAAKRMGLPFYNEVRGFWELSREAREPGYANTSDFQLEACRDTFVAHNAEQVFTLNQPMLNELSCRGVNSSKISIIPNGVSQIPVIKTINNELRYKLGINKDYKVVGYIGSINTYEGLDVLLQACANLVQKGEKLKLLLVGDDQPITQVVGTNKALESKPWLIHVPRVPHEQVGDFYALLDVVVIPRKPLEVCQLVPPLKAAEALAYGKRLVVSDVAPLAEYAQKYEGVVSFDAGKIVSLETALQYALNLPTPKPSCELLFSSHIWPMVQALRREYSESVSQSEVHKSVAVSQSTVTSRDKKNTKLDSRSYIESEVVDYYYGKPIFADGHKPSPRFYDLSDNVLIWNIKTKKCQEVDLFFKLKRDNSSSAFTTLKEVVAKIEYFDEFGNNIECPDNIPKSTSVGNYSYLKFNESGFTKLSLPVPSDAVRLQVKAIKWGDNKPVSISGALYTSSYKPGVSVIIPSYKGKGTILECLNSLAHQTLPKRDFEIVIILNGVPDGTSYVIETFKNNNPEVNVLLTTNDVAGAGSARNYGVSLANRKFITFIDDDDFVSPNFLQGLIQHADSSKVVVSNIEDFNGSGFFESTINKQIKINSGCDLIAYEKITSAVTLNACKLMPTRYAKSIQYNKSLKSGEDVEYWTKLVCLFKPSFYCVKKSQNAIYYRRVRENSVSRQAESFEFNVKQRLEVVIELEKIVPNDAMQAFINSKVNAQLGFTNRYLSKNPEKWLEFKDLADSMGLSSRAFQYVNEKHSKTLVISYCFPPYIDTAGIVCSKRIIQFNKPVDVISNTMNAVRDRDDSLWKLVKPYVGRFHEVQAYPSFSNWKAIEDFCNKVLNIVEKNISKYTSIYSRSMWPGSHFAAALLKIKYPSLIWEAEFSDPLRVDVHGKERHVEMRSDWLIENSFVNTLENNELSDAHKASLFYWCEMLPYMFADKFIFTNKSQKLYMLSMLSDEKLKSRVEDRSLVSQHPTLEKKFYNLSNYNYVLDKSKVNIAYFGTFYATRGIGDVLTALDILPKKLKEKVNIHIFTQKPEAVVFDESLKYNVTVNKIIPYLDFLTVSQRFDALVVNDAETKKYKWINPYLPSKLSDYKGSGSSIWALFEESSELSQFGTDHRVMYKSEIGNKMQGKSILNRLVLDKFGDC